MMNKMKLLLPSSMLFLKEKKAFIVYKCVALLLLPFAFHVYFSPL